MTLHITWLNEVYDWGEKKGIPVEVWRDEQAIWKAAFVFRDAKGLFRSEPIVMPEHISNRVITGLPTQLDRVCVRARQSRIGLTRVLP